MKNSIWYFFFAVTFMVYSSTAHAEKWVITTTEWPPFICSRCPENGAAAKALRETMKTQGVEVEFIFSTWTQAVFNGAAKDKIGYFPIWAGDLKDGFVASETLFKSPLGFVEPRGKPLIWNKLADLKGKVIGVGRDYRNTPEFNKLVADGVIKTEVVGSDDTNMRKVALGKLDGALIDVNNAKYFLTSTLKNLSKDVAISPKIIDNVSLHIALNPHSHEKNKMIKAGLEKVNFQRIVDMYLSKYLVDANQIPCEFCFSSASPVLAQYP